MQKRMTEKQYLSMIELELWIKAKEDEAWLKKERDEFIKDVIKALGGFVLGVGFFGVFGFLCLCAACI